MINTILKDELFLGLYFGDSGKRKVSTADYMEYVKHIGPIVKQQLKKEYNICLLTGPLYIQEALIKYPDLFKIKDDIIKCVAKNEIDSVGLIGKRIIRWYDIDIIKVARKASISYFTGDNDVKVIK